MNAECSHSLAAHQPTSRTRTAHLRPACRYSASQRGAAPTCAPASALAWSPRSRCSAPAAASVAFSASALRRAFSACNSAPRAAGVAGQEEAQHSAAQHNRAQHSMHSTAQRSAAQRSTHLLLLKLPPCLAGCGIRPLQLHAARLHQLLASRAHKGAGPLKACARPSGVVQKRQPRVPPGQLATGRAAPTAQKSWQEPLPLPIGPVPGAHCTAQYSTASRTCTTRRRPGPRTPAAQRSAALTCASASALAWSASCCSLASAAASAATRALSCGERGGRAGAKEWGGGGGRRRGPAGSSVTHSTSLRSTAQAPAQRGSCRERSARP